MPSSPPQFQQEKEGGHESNGSSCSEIPPPPLEAGPPPPSSEATEQIQNPMLMLMAGEAAASAAARLGMPTALSALTGEGQTRNSEPTAASQSPQEIPTRPTEFVTGEQSRPGQLHVAKSSELEQNKQQKENDITSKVNMVVTNTVDVGMKEDTDADKEQDDAKKHQARADKSFATESQIPLTSTSASAGRSEHRQQQQGPLSAKIVQQSIMGAVAAVASARPKESLESEVEDGSESKKMAANNDHSDNNKKPRRKRKPQVKLGQSSGRWTVDEHRAFLEGLRECGREWKKVALRIPTRTSAQIRSHAQKYFSKLQRDHENLMNHPGDHSSSAGGGGVAAAEIQQMQPSVQGSADRIVANPHAAQREVENTLEALRERYRQLQQRLEQRQRLRSNNNNNNRSQVVEDDSSGATNPTRKRALEEPGAADHRSAASSMDDQSSVSSAVSASAASLASARDLGNEELIALSVLGADLARGDPSNDGFSPPAPGSRRSPESSDNSTSDKSEEQGNSTSNKRHKKEA